MKSFLAAALLTIVASPALSATGQLRPPGDAVAPVDRIYPEMEIEGDGWRGLLKVMLLNSQMTAQPRSADSSPIETPPQ